ncbi:MAG TPA: hypothetical protein VF534_03785 [Paraburkholderia sp.]
MTKTLLLLIDRASASGQSLSNHLALVASRTGHENPHLVNELLRAVYLSWFLQHAGYGTCPTEHLKIAECAVEAALRQARESGKWPLPVDTVEDFETLLALYDGQLARAPLHVVLAAEQRLRTFLAGSLCLGIDDCDLYLAGSGSKAALEKLPTIAPPKLPCATRKTGC